MANILLELNHHVLYLTLNRVEKHNAFDDTVLTELQHALLEAIANPQVRVIVLRANGRHFSAGADLEWMQRMADFSEAENLEDAQILARLMYTLYTCPKPTLACVQGAAFGGGAGLVAACDIAIAAHSARFCFSEVKLGLIPATISPYVVQAIGARAATALFMSAESVDANQALNLRLIHHCVTDEELDTFTQAYAKRLVELAPQAVRDSKALVRQIDGQPINEAQLQHTAELIAKKRASPEGQRGLMAFLRKEQPQWD